MSTLSEIAANHALQGEALEAEPICIANLYPAVTHEARLPHSIEQIPTHAIAAMTEAFIGNATGCPV